ncbi:hypothetical protein DPMN_056932 [Dreissena polymorpha]|uniref:Uncharacterized protein n=1 Tax=Dreissena polymorpha TaxID=45954 RepID=A0A9D4HTZ3_DREPO|nr:hypothetical protein DPMN_056932 [Dreissena polymorpha]
MKTKCDVNAAEIATNGTSDMMIGTESALKCTTSVVEATTSTSQAAQSITKCKRKQAHAMKPKQTIKDAVREARATTEIQKRETKQKACKDIIHKKIKSAQKCNEVKQDLLNMDTNSYDQDFHNQNTSCKTSTDKLLTIQSETSKTPSKQKRHQKTNFKDVHDLDAYTHNVNLKSIENNFVYGYEPTNFQCAHISDEQKHHDSEQTSKSSQQDMNVWVGLLFQIQLQDLSISLIVDLVLNRVVANKCLMFFDLCKIF